MYATIDFETYSETDVTVVGAYRYARHPSTDIICMYYQMEGWDERQRWLPGHPFPEVLLGADELHAHNSAFERYIWQYVATPRYGWPSVPFEIWHCTLASAAYRAMPLGLGPLGEALNIEHLKDMSGRAALKKIMKPDRKGHRPTYDEAMIDYETTYLYCDRDVLAESEAHAFLGNLPSAERRLWLLDQRTNDRGIRVDRELCEAAVAIQAEYKAQLNLEIFDLTDCEITKATQRERIREWVGRNSGHLPAAMGADYLEEWLPNVDLDPEIRRVIECYRESNRTSASKYATALVCTTPEDPRARGLLQYHGATTGRWAGRLIQPQNFPRPTLHLDMEEMVAAIKRRDMDELREMGKGNPIAVLADATRGILTAEPGHELIGGDYSSIESVLTAAIAGEQWKLDLFARGDCAYCAFASKVNGFEVQKSIAKDKTHPDHILHAGARQDQGKPGELAFGFGGGVGAWYKFDHSGKYVDNDIEKFRDAWRELHPNTKRLWEGVDRASRAAITNPGKKYTYKGPGCDVGVTYLRKGRYLLCQLPSGRLLHYYRPSLKLAPMPWTDVNGDPVFRECVHYWAMKDIGNGKKIWAEVRSWFGTLVENIVQATARDLLAPAMLRLEAAGYPVVLTVHDEIVCEVPRGFGSDEEFAHLMTIKPDWAEGWPIMVGEPDRMQHFQKGD